MNTEHHFTGYIFRNDLVNLERYRNLSFVVTKENRTIYVQTCVKYIFQRLIYLKNHYLTFWEVGGKLGSE